MINPATLGLTSAEAARRLDEYGPNEPTPARRLSALLAVRAALRQSARHHPAPRPARVAAWLGEDVDAGIIVTIVLLSVSVNFWQSYRSQQAADRLRTSVAPTATVCRDGAWRELPVREVVPGDVIRLSAGDLVPADARLLESRDLSVQQSMLTGESLPADKTASAGAATATAGPRRTRSGLPRHLRRQRHRHGARDRRPGPDALR